MIIAVTLAVALLGLLLFLLSNKPEVKEIGRISFAVGLIVFLLNFGGAAINLLHR